MLALVLSPINAADAAGVSVSVTDDAGERIMLSGPARRIVTLAPALAEILFHVGGGQYLVGTVDHSDYPEDAQQVQRIGSHDRFDFESILQLEPDLVLAWKSGIPAARSDGWNNWA